MRPIKANDLVRLDTRMRVEYLGGYNNPQQICWYAGKQDYSEVPIYTKTPPDERKAGQWIVDQLLSNERGHYGPLEHPQITLNACGFVHNVMVQARTHRVGVSFDVQSQRYTGKRIVQVAKREIPIEDVFYVRPEGYYTNREGKKYEWTETHRARKLARCLVEAEEYNSYYQEGMAEEHIRDYLPQAVRQDFVVSFNLRSILHFMDLRSKLDAQLEIQAFSDLITNHLKNWAPDVWNYYEEKRLHRAKLAP